MAGMRSRWAAIGAAVAVTLGAGGLATAVAQQQSDPSNFHPLTPVRVLDTRDGTGTGGLTTKIGPGQTFNLDIDSHPDVAAGAGGVMLNVTAVDGNQGGWMTVYPTAATRPLASNLNWTDGSPQPNLVTVPFGQNGDISFYNSQGEVHVVADLVGYYTPSFVPASLGAMSRFENGTDTKASGQNLAFTAETAAVGTDVVYDPGTQTFTLGPVGTYRVTYNFTVDATSVAGSSQVELDNVAVGPERAFASGGSAVENLSDSMQLTTSAVDTSLEVVVTSAAGNVVVNQASITIERIA